MCGAKGGGCLLLRVSNENPEPLYQQIVGELRRLILTGRLAPGEPLPSIRELAQQLTTSVITTRRAYLELERQGLIATRPGLGTFVAKLSLDRAKEAVRAAAADRLAAAVAEARKLGLSNDEIAALFERALQGGNVNL